MRRLAAATAVAAISVFTRGVVLSMAGQAEYRWQQTLSRVVEIAGCGLFHGREVCVRLLPAAADAGVVFRRVDLAGAPEVPALVDYAVCGGRRTVLRNGAAAVETTEHLLAALAGLQIDNCIVELDAGEVPAVDGSCLPFCEAILDAGVQMQNAPAPASLQLPLQRVGDPADGQWIESIPGHGLEISYQLDYGLDSVVPPQSLVVEITPEVFLREIAAARTFVLETEVEALQRAGFGRHLTGADLLVFAADGSVIDNQLRWPDEPVRHKILDCLGDMFLCGQRLEGRIVACRSGHRLNQLLANVVRSDAMGVTSAESCAGELLRAA